MKRITIVSTVILISITLIAIYAYVIEPNNLTLEKIDIKLNPEKQNPGESNLTIIHLSDFHFDNSGGKEEEIIKTVNEINPDYIFITGDFVDNPDKIKPCTEFLSKLTKDHKTYGVLGNWEHKISNDPGELNELIKELGGAGVKILMNEHVKLEDNLYLIGVDDPHTGHDELDMAMHGMPGNSTTILLAHSPEIIDKASDQKIDIVLVGHAHGGQVRIPFYGPLWIPSKYGTKYSSGLYPVENGGHKTQMYVNRGIGTTSNGIIFKIRMFCSPEIAEIKVT